MGGTVSKRTWTKKALKDIWRQSPNLMSRILRHTGSTLPDPKNVLQNGRSEGRMRFWVLEKKRESSPLKEYSCDSCDLEPLIKDLNLRINSLFWSLFSVSRQERWKQEHLDITLAALQPLEIAVRCFWA